MRTIADAAVPRPRDRSMPTAPRLRGTWICAALWALGVAAAAAAEHGAPASTSLCAEVANIAAAHRVPGAFVLVTTPRHVVSRCAFGDFARRSDQESSSTRFVRIGSITKTFNALAAQRLAAAGRLALTAACDASFCPQPRPGELTPPVTLEQLLEHTAGVSDLLPREMAHNTPLDPAAAFALAPASRRLRWPPGRYSSYSNNSAAIAAGLMEQRTGRSYESLVHDFVLTPLGMYSATFARSPAVQRALPVGYAADGRTPLPYWHMLFPAMGALNLSTDDMVALIQLFLNRGRHAGKVFLSPAAISRMERPAASLAARHGLTYGYSLGLYQWYRRGMRFFGHDGDADGYRSRFAYAPALARGYFVAINSDNREALLSLQRSIERALVGTGAPVPPIITLGHAAIAAITGNYAAVTSRFAAASPRQLRVVATGSRLHTIEPGAAPRELLPLGDGYFRRAGEGGATIVFIPAPGEALLLGDDLGNYRRISGD